jgi:hypothetical protein
LRMRPWQAWNIPNKKPGIGAKFDYCGDVFHILGPITICDQLGKIVCIGFQKEFKDIFDCVLTEPFRK